MSERQQRVALKREAQSLDISPLLWTMVQIIYEVRGYDAAMVCLREGKAQGI